MWVSSDQASWRMSANSFETRPNWKFLVACMGPNRTVKIHYRFYFHMFSNGNSIIEISSMVETYKKYGNSVCKSTKFYHRYHGGRETRLLIGIWSEDSAISCRARRSRWRRNRGGTDVGWFSKWNFWLYPTTKIKKNIRKKKRLFCRIYYQFQILQ